MAYDGYIADLPLGNQGLVKRDNRHQQVAGDLIVCSGMTFEDNSLRKEMGATSLDSAGVAGAPIFTGTLAGSDAWAGVMYTFYGSGIAVGGTATSTTKAAGAGTSKTIATPASGYASGSLVVVTVTVLDTKDAPTTAVINSLTDAKGNSWASLNEVILANALTPLGRVRVFYSILTNALVSGDLITVPYSSDVASSIAVANYTSTVAWVAGPTAFNRSIQNNGAPSIGPTKTLAQIPALLVCGLGSLAQTDTPGSGFTEQIEQGGGTGVASVNHRIDTTSPGIIALFDWKSDVQTAPAGTVSTTLGSTTLTGVGTTFTNFAPGDKIILANGETQVISTISSATVLNTVSAWQTTNAGVAYQRRVGNRLITATIGGNLFKDKPATLATTNLDDTTLKAGLSLVARPGFFVQGGKEAAALNRKLFYFNGVDPVQVLSGDGTTTTAIATPPADWSASSDPLKQPLGGCIHNLRLCGYGNLNDPHRLYFSDPDNHENFTSAAAFNLRVQSNIGDRIYRAVDYQGILLVWKYPRGIFYLDDSDISTVNWQIRTKSEALGCAPSPYAVLPLDDDVLFMASDGQFHMLSAVDSFGGVRESNLSYALGFANWIRDNVNLARLDLVTSVWFPQKKVAYFGVPAAGSNTNTYVLKFDFSGVNAGKPVLFSITARDSADALALRQGTDLVPRPIIGEAGFVWSMEQSARDKGGYAYTGTFQTAHDDLAWMGGAIEGNTRVPQLRYKRKLFEHLELVMEPVNAGTVVVQPYVDGVARGPALTFDPTKRRQRRKLNVGDGYTFSFSVTESTLDGDMNIIGAGLYFKDGNEDENR